MCKRGSWSCLVHRIDISGNGFGWWVVKCCCFCLVQYIWKHIMYLFNWVGTVHTAWILQRPPRFYISVSWRRHTLKLRLPLWGKSASHICNHKIICHRYFLPAVRLAEGLADDHRDRLLAVPRDCPLKIKIVRRKRKICEAKSTMPSICKCSRNILVTFCCFFLWQYGSIGVNPDWKIADLCAGSSPGLFYTSCDVVLLLYVSF